VGLKVTLINWELLTGSVIENGRDGAVKPNTEALVPLIVILLMPSVLVKEPVLLMNSVLVTVLPAVTPSREMVPPGATGVEL
jgi:hypothetical protein